jgi:hypothetical protein
MSDRTSLLGDLAVGNIFHAEYPNGASCICLVLSASDTEIKSRRITTQEIIDFDRRTGVKIGDDREIPCLIDSVAPLPAEIHGVFLAMDEKYRTLMAMDEKSRFADLERLKLTDAEKKALLFVADHYPSNPLPPLA